jgi:hypothetical protein
MTTKLLPSGKEFIARNLSGKCESINCMYVEYGPSPVADVHDVSHDYFNSLAKGGKQGFARIAITNISVEGSKLTFFGMLTSDDFVGDTPPKNSYLTTVTIASSKDTNRLNDTLIMTSVIGSDTKVIKGAYITVCASMEIGL